MYSFMIESQLTRQPDIKRRMVADNVWQLIPVIIAMCQTEFNFVNPVALYMGDGRYRLFDLENPTDHAIVKIYDDTYESN